MVGSIKMVWRKTAGTTRAANQPNDAIGGTPLIVHEAKVMAEVREVTSMALAAFRHAQLSLRIGSFLRALCWKLHTQKSWKTKTSSQPMPRTMKPTAKWRVWK